MYESPKDMSAKDSQAIEIYMPSRAKENQGGGLGPQRVEDNSQEDEKCKCLVN